MATTHRLTRIANPSSLRSINAKLRASLLRPFEPWLAARGVKLSPAANLDCDRLSVLLLGVDGDPPPELLDLVCLIDDISADRHEEKLRALASKLKINYSADAPNIDIAVRVAIKNATALFELHAATLADRFRTVDRVAALCKGIPTPHPITSAMKARIEDLLNGVFEEKGRDRSAVVVPIELPIGPGVLISRGDTMKRQSIVEAQNRRTMLLRPETFDFVCWDRENGDLLVRAQSKGDLAAYCKVMGLCLFGDRFMFMPQSTHRYTLAPIRENGPASLSYAAFDGIDWVQLDSIEARDHSLDGTPVRMGQPRPWEALAHYASPLDPFKMVLRAKIVGEKRERRIRIVPPYRIECELDDTATLFGCFLKGGGFMLPRPETPNEADLTLWDLR
jgi:hypothetical protein